MRVLKWSVPVDDDWHEIGMGEVMLVAAESPELLHVWTLEPEDDEAAIWADMDIGPDRVKVARAWGTGQPGIPGSAFEHLGSAVASPFVWHVFAMRGNPSCLWV